jgi:hypothetical protein
MTAAFVTIGEWFRMQISEPAKMLRCVHFPFVFILFTIIISLAECYVGIRDYVSLVEGSSAENNVGGSEWRCALGCGCIGGTT